MKTRHPIVTAKILSLACVLTTLCTAASTYAQTEVFSDNFDRADGTVGNSWSISSSGNGGSGGGTSPTAEIFNNKLVLERAGWGPDAKVVLSQNIPDATSLSATMLTPSAIGGTSGGTESSSLIAANSATGAYVRVSLFNSNTTGLFNVRIASSEDGIWPNWGYQSSDMSNPGELLVNITLGGAGSINVTAEQMDSTIVASWSTTNTGIGSAFDQIRIQGDWTAWTSPSGYQLSIDSITATTIPEPSSVAMLLGFLCLSGTLIIRKR